MQRRWLNDVKEALAKALQGLNGMRMTPADDPQLAALKDDIRRTIEEPRSEKKEAA
jgi:CHASE3 domain sensor protein